MLLRMFWIEAHTIVRNGKAEVRLAAERDLEHRSTAVFKRIGNDDLEHPKEHRAGIRIQRGCITVYQ